MCGERGAPLERQRRHRYRPALAAGGPGDQGRPGVRQPDEPRVDTGKAPRRVFLVPDQLLQQGQPLAAVFRRPGDACPATLPLGALPGQVVLTHSGVVARSWFGRLVLVEPGTDPVTELLLIRREIQVHSE